MAALTCETEDEKDQKSRPLTLGQLGPGLHMGVIELLTRDSYGVRLLDGRRISARCSPYVHTALVEECLREQRPMLLSDGAQGPEIVGALQVAPSIAPDIDGNLTISARQVSLKAENGVRVESGRSELRLSEDGRVRLTAERAVFDVASNLRIYSSLVELP